MTQNPGQWGAQGGYPPQGQPGPGGYPQQQPGGYPPQPQPGGYPQQQPGGYPPQQGAYSPQGAYNPRTGYTPAATFPPQGAPGGVPPQGAGGFPPQGTPPPKKSPIMLIGIVVAAVVLLAAIGGIILVLNKGGKTQPGSTITPTQPTSQPTEQPTEQPSGQSTQPTEQPTDQQTTQPGQSIDLGGGISLTPAEGYQVEKTDEGYARLSNGKQIFIGQTGKLDPSTNPGQFCDSFHHKVTEGNANPRYAEPKTVNVNPKVKAATCQAVSTVSAGSGSGDVFVASLVSIRTDGVALIGTIFFTKGADTNQLNKDFSFMVNSMLTGQIAGG
jgi:hypothetical protein